MDRIIRVVGLVPPLLFISMGLRWLVLPDAAADALGLPLMEDGVARSSQIGDMASFFLSIGGFMLLGVIRRARIWIWAGSALLGAAAVARVIAWLFQDAALALEFIVPEVVMAAFMVFVASRIEPAE